MNVNPPRVFISYSHDSAEHKKWVLDFATTLRNRGIDAILDQWDLKPGDDLPQFMEQNLAAADRAIMVCTKRYVQKANAGEGGVGYEKMIMTSSSLSKISANKVIPIIREKGDPATPTFLATKLYIDFTKDSEIEFALDDLLRHLLDAPLYQKPKIGKDPFRPLNKARPDATADGIRTLMTDVAKAYDATSLKMIGYIALQNISSMHRFTLDKYLQEAKAKGLLYTDQSAIYITDKGRSYLNEQGIVEA
jgi:hypothetical protein